MSVKFIPLVLLIIGLVVLFFFPEPETNFVAYLITAFVFIVLIIFSYFLTK